ncbi:MAG: radical SAM protein [Candidatus Pacebacteria bacterium]|nr:radical SAM protein [Candidatus Paceibacterota bacterium]
MSKLKTLLINPPLSLEDRYGKQLKHFGALSEPMGLAYIAASLQSYKYPVKILDCPAMGITLEQLAEHIKECDFDIVGITMLTPMYSKVKKTAETIKKIRPKTKIIVGGAHATALPEETLKDIPEIDFACVGEGEKTILDFVRFLEGEKNVEEVDGLFYRKDGIISRNKPREFEANIDNFPPPSRDLLPIEKYKLTASRVMKGSFAPTLIVARGCPFNCLYCSHPFGRTYRRHSVQRVIEEMESLMEKYDIREFNIEADSLAVDRNFVLSLCEEMIKKGISKKIRWTCENRMDLIDEELLKKMKEAGCWQISYGVESGVQRLLNLINKGETLEQMEKAFRLTKKIGITIRGFFMLGLPTETREESMKTIKFAKKIDPLWAQFTITIPYPGTPLFEMLKKEGKIKSFNWDNYNTWGGWAEKTLPFVAEGRTEKELKLLQKKALISFYMRPKVFFRFIKTINSLESFKKYSRGFFTLLKTSLK